MKNKGISLIVLIITIVVIIILAAAVILTINKNNPVESAKKATFVNDLSAYQDELSMYIGNKYIETKGDFKLTELDNKALEEVISVSEKYKEKFTIKDGKIIGTDKLTEQEQEWAKSITNGETGSVTPPVPTIPVPEGGSAYKDSDGIEVPIPGGFVVSGVAGENKVSDGLVIKEGKDPNAKDTDVNEFVWIPVPDITEMYDEATKRGKLYDFSAGRVSTLRADCLTTTKGFREPAYLTSSAEGDASSFNTVGITVKTVQEEFDAMIASVKKYGGFYIGRYETGNLSQSKAVVRKLNKDISNKDWYVMYDKIKKMINNEYVQTNIIWGSQWDATLRWMNKDSNIGDYVVDGTGKGNYYAQTFSYTNEDGEVTVKPSNTGTLIPTGGYEGSKVKNIYDMAGNVRDRSFEANSTGYRTLRGGSCSIDYSSTGNPVSNRIYNFANYNSNDSGARAQLYLK